MTSCRVAWRILPLSHRVCPTSIVCTQCREQAMISKQAQGCKLEDTVVLGCKGFATEKELFFSSFGAVGVSFSTSRTLTKWSCPI